MVAGRKKHGRGSGLVQSLMRFDGTDQAHQLERVRTGEPSNPLHILSELRGGAGPTAERQAGQGRLVALQIRGKGTITQVLHLLIGIEEAGE